MQMTNKFLLIIPILAFSSNNVLAKIDRDSGAQLLLNCTNTAKAFANQAIDSADEQVKAGLCLGFISGVAQTSESMTNKLCPPKGVNLRDKFWVVMDFLKRHKEHLGSSAGLMVFKALEEKYPCR